MVWVPGASSWSLDEIQYCAHGGPCVAAVAGSEEVTVSIPSPEWEKLSTAALATGYRSLRSVPLAAHQSELRDIATDIVARATGNPTDPC